MATLNELRGFFAGDDGSILRNKIQSALILAAEIVQAGNDDGAPYSQVAGDHDKRVTWALTVFGNTEEHAQKFLEMVLAKNKTATVAQINGASDSTINTNVEESVDFFAGVTV